MEVFWEYFGRGWPEQFYSSSNMSLTVQPLAYVVVWGMSKTVPGRQCWSLYARKMSWIQEQLQRILPGGSGSLSCGMKLEAWVCSALQNEHWVGYGCCSMSGEKIGEEGKFLNAIDNSGARLRTYKWTNIDLDFLYEKVSSILGQFRNFGTVSWWESRWQCRCALNIVHIV